jgi:predicted GH43/DUF377 family glycosyl hydrolase
MKMRKTVLLLVCLVVFLSACASVTTTLSQSVATEPSPLPTATTEIQALPSATPESKNFFTLYSNTPIVPKGASGTWDDRFTDPGAVIYYDGIFHMFRNGFRGFPATSQVGYVTSPDGYTWTKQGDDPVFETKDVTYAKVAMYASSALVEDDGTWVIYFYTWDSLAFPGASVIGRATASVPTGPWAADAEPVLLPGIAGEWDEQQVLAPHVIKSDDGYIMYYSGTNKGGKQQIGMATSMDGIRWTKYNDENTTAAPYADSDPVLQPSISVAWDQGMVHQPRVFRTQQGWVMFYRGTKDASGNTMALGLATSDDGIHWKKSALNPIFLPNGISKSRQFWFDNVLLVNDTYFVFIEGDVNQTTQIYLATYLGEIPK